MHTYNSLYRQIADLGLKKDDTLLIHSSLKSVGEIEGGAETLLEALEDYFKDGLLIFPTHTWSYIQKDGDVFDKVNSDSCVGALTNIARKRQGYYRSNHPTHSVCAKGNKAYEYVQLDNETSTPTKPDGCFGILKDINGYILFLGAKLSKNTFVHSIEEAMNVPNRFTDKKFNFITLMEDGTKKEYQTYRHYNKECPHISDNYEKLLPFFLEKNIAQKHQIGDAECYLVDAKKCFDFVCDILNQDIDALSTNKDIKNLIR